MLFGRSGEKTRLRPPENRSIGQGHALIIYAAVEFERYWAEAARTFTIKEASFSEITSDATAVYGRAIDAIKPGRTVSQLYKDVLEDAGRSGLELLSDYGLGGGIGLSLNELPVINEKGAQKLKEGMCLSLRLAVKDKTYGSTMFGNTLLVGKNGAEVLT
jgi:Xaa-Pro aminopeptidase/Xaa-Pro dipeptidase